MRRRHSWVLLAGLMGAGCLSAPQHHLPLVPPQQVAAPAPAGEAAAEAKELPAVEAARVCEATADLLAQKGQDREAIALYEKARKADPKQHKLCRRLAVLYDRQDDYPKALEEYAKAIQMYPRDASLHNDLGYCHYCRGKWAEAEQALRKALEIDATMKRAWINLGLCQAQQERYEEALGSFCKSVPEAQAHANLAFVLTAQGKTDAARGAYHKAMQLDPGLARVGEALDRLDGKGPPPQVAQKKLDKAASRQSASIGWPPPPAAVGADHAAASFTPSSKRQGVATPYAHSDPAVFVEEGEGSEAAAPATGQIILTEPQ